MLPVEHVGGGGDVLWKLIRNIQFLVLNKVRDKLGAGLPVIELSERKECRSDSSANELFDLPLIDGGDEEGPVGVVDDSEVLLKLKDMFKD